MELVALAPVAVIIPVLDEAEAIGFVLRELPRPPMTDVVATDVVATDVVVVDGGSRDGTPEVARAAGARVIVAGRGYGRACAAGAAAADPGCGILVFLDGDGADRADLLARLVAPIAAGTHDFVLATRAGAAREQGAMSWHQLLAGWLAGQAMRALYGVHYTDMCAFRAIRRDCLERLDMREMTFGWNIEMQMKCARAGLRVLEVPLPYRRRRGGRSKVAGTLGGTLRAGARILRTLVRVALVRRPLTPTRGRAAPPARCR